MRPSRAAAAVFAAIVLVTIPASASAAGPLVTYTVRSDAIVGTNGWYRSDVVADIQVQDATDTTCPAVKTFRSNREVLD